VQEKSKRRIAHGKLHREPEKVKGNIYTIRHRPETAETIGHGRCVWKKGLGKENGRTIWFAAKRLLTYSASGTPPRSYLVAPSQKRFPELAASGCGPLG